MYLIAATKGLCAVTSEVTALIGILTAVASAFDDFVKSVAAVTSEVAALVGILTAVASVLDVVAMNYYCREFSLFPITCNKSGIKFD